MKSVLQMADTVISPQLGILNGQLSDVFGEKYSSIFMRVRPNQLLFNGIPLCVDTSGITKIICSVIKRQRPITMKLMKDDSFRFAFFEHVSYGQKKKKKYYIVQCKEIKQKISFGRKIIRTKAYLKCTPA